MFTRCRQHSSNKVQHLFILPHGTDTCSAMVVVGKNLVTRILPTSFEDWVEVINLKASFEDWVEVIKGKLNNSAPLFSNLCSHEYSCWEAFYLKHLALHSPVLEIHEVLKLITEISAKGNFSSRSHQCTNFVLCIHSFVFTKLVLHAVAKWLPLLDLLPSAKTWDCWYQFYEIDFPICQSFVVHKHHQCTIFVVCIHSFSCMYSQVHNFCFLHLLVLEQATLITVLWWRYEKK